MFCARSQDLFLRHVRVFLHQLLAVLVGKVHKSWGRTLWLQFFRFLLILIVALLCFILLDEPGVLRVSALRLVRHREVTFLLTLGWLLLVADFVVFSHLLEWSPLSFWHVLPFLSRLIERLSEFERRIVLAGFLNKSAVEVHVATLSFLRSWT